MSSGAMSTALKELTPAFERASGLMLVVVSGGSVAGAPDSIPDRLQRGERADVVIVAATGIDDLIKAGRLVAGSRVDLARSSIGVAVRAGAPKPDTSSVDALKRARRAAKSVAYSSSVSGVYVSTELFQRLGIAPQLLARSRRIDGEPVAAVVARRRSGDRIPADQRAAPGAGRGSRRPAAASCAAGDGVLRLGRSGIGQPNRRPGADRVPLLVRRLRGDRPQRHGPGRQPSALSPQPLALRPVNLI